MVNFLPFLTHYVFILIHLTLPPIRSETITNPGTGIIQCQGGEDCIILCHDANTCMNAQINCPTGYKCTLTCGTSNRACQQSTVNAVNATRFEINDCSSGKKSTCSGMTIYFPPNINRTPVSFFNVGDNFNGFISDMQFYAINGWSDVNTTGYTGTYQTHTGTMYCTDTYNSSCSFQTNPEEWNCLDTDDLTCDIPTPEPTISPTSMPTSNTFNPTTVSPTSVPTSITNNPTSITSNPTTAIPTNHPTTMNPTTNNPTITPTANPTISTATTTTTTTTATATTSITSNNSRSTAALSTTNTVTAYTTDDTITTTTTTDTVTTLNIAVTLQTLITTTYAAISNTSNATIHNITPLLTTLRSTIFMTIGISLETTYTMNEIGASTDSKTSTGVIIGIISGIMLCIIIVTLGVYCGRIYCTSVTEKRLQSVFGIQSFKSLSIPKETEKDKAVGEIAEEGMQPTINPAILETINNMTAHQVQNNPFHISRQRASSAYENMHQILHGVQSSDNHDGRARAGTQPTYNAAQIAMYEQYRMMYLAKQYNGTHSQQNYFQYPQQQQIASPHHPQQQQITSPHHPQRQSMSSAHHPQQQPISSPHHAQRQSLSSPYHQQQQRMVSPHHQQRHSMSSPHQPQQQPMSPYHPQRHGHSVSSPYHPQQQYVTSPHHVQRHSMSSPHHPQQQQRNHAVSLTAQCQVISPQRPHSNSFPADIDTHFVAVNPSAHQQGIEIIYKNDEQNEQKEHSDDVQIVYDEEKKIELIEEEEHEDSDSHHTFERCETDQNLFPAMPRMKTEWLEDDIDMHHNKDSKHYEHRDSDSHHTFTRFDTQQSLFDVMPRMRTEWLTDDIDKHHNMQQQLELEVIQDSNGKEDLTDISEMELNNKTSFKE